MIHITSRHKTDVDGLNETELKRLSDGKGLILFTSSDYGSSEPALRQLKANTKAPERLELRVGAQVCIVPR